MYYLNDSLCSDKYFDYTGTKRNLVNGQHKYIGIYFDLKYKYKNKNKNIQFFF